MDEDKKLKLVIFGIVESVQLIWIFLIIFSPEQDEIVNIGEIVAIVSVQLMLIRFLLDGSSKKKKDLDKSNTEDKQK